MPEMRLYVGGLSDKVDRAALGLRLSHYVSVSDIDLKEKTDADGNVLFKFAHVSIDAPSSQIEECMRQLNGASWHGSFLRIEPAKESFLDRLKRERATIRQQEKQQSSHDEKVETSASAVTFPKIVEEKGGAIIIQRPQKDLKAERSDAVNKNQTKMKKREKTSNESAQVEISLHKDAMHTSEGQKEKKRKKLKRKVSEKTCITAENKLPLLIKSNSKKKNKVEEEMLSSFKSFSSVWADSDSENNETLDDKRNNIFDDDKNDSSEPNRYNDLISAESSFVKSLRPCKEVKSAEQVEENIVCEPDAENKYVKITKDLNFGQKSSGFSLLAQFSQQRKTGDEESGTEEVTVPVSALSRPVVLQQCQVKKKNFFVLPSEPRIEAAITWMAQLLTEEIREEFTEAQPHLRELYKTRAVRALRKQQDGRGRGRGTGSRNPNENYKW